MAYYRECPFCHCSLDPGEKCDCQEEKARREEEQEKRNGKYFTIEKNGQLRIAV